MSRRPGYPVSLYVAGRRCLVVGDGDAADARAAALREAGGLVERVGRADWAPERARGAFLVLAHSDDPAWDRQVALDARPAGCLVYAHDGPEVSDFAMPARVQRGPLSIAIATDALAPALARRLREELDRVLSAGGAALDRLLAEMIRRRAALPPERRRELTALAERLRLTGALVVDPEPAAAPPTDTDTGDPPPRD